MRKVASWGTLDVVRDRRLAELQLDAMALRGPLAGTDGNGGVFVAGTLGVASPWHTGQSVAVRTLLYLMMGTASWLAWRWGPGAATRAGAAERAYGVQLVLNLAWSLVFFGLRAPGLGLAVIGALWVANLETIRRFYRRSPFAAALLVPYQLWVTFATALNAAVWWLNRG